MKYKWMKLNYLATIITFILNVDLLTDGNISARHFRLKQTRAMPLA